MIKLYNVETCWMNCGENRNHPTIVLKTIEEGYEKVFLINLTTRRNTMTSNIACIKYNATTDISRSVIVVDGEEYNARYSHCEYRYKKIKCAKVIELIKASIKEFYIIGTNGLRVKSRIEMEDFIQTLRQFR